MSPGSVERHGVGTNIVPGQEAFQADTRITSPHRHRWIEAKLADGQIEAIRLRKVARDTAVKAQKTAMITLKATLVTAPDELRGSLRPLTDHKLILACAALDVAGDMSEVHPV